MHFLRKFNRKSRFLTLKMNKLSGAIKLVTIHIHRQGLDYPGVIFTAVFELISRQFAVEILKFQKFLVNK